jgi:hypothetical protein
MDKASLACLVRWKALLASTAQTTMIVIIMAPVSAVRSAPMECNRLKPNAFLPPRQNLRSNPDEAFKTAGNTAARARAPHLAGWQARIFAGFPRHRESSARWNPAR